MPVAVVLTAKHSLAVLLLVLISGSLPGCYAAQNITAILAAYPDLAEFSSLLTSAHLAKTTSTIAPAAPSRSSPNDTAMASVKTMTREAIWGHLSLHVLLDCYYDDAELQRLPLGGSTLVSTLFHDAGGGTPGVYGMVRIVKFSDASGVGFLPMAGNVAGAGVGKAAFFVKSVYGAPYNISVLQVSGVMSTVTPAGRRVRLQGATLLMGRLPLEPPTF